MRLAYVKKLYVIIIFLVSLALLSFDVERVLKWYSWDKLFTILGNVALRMGKQ